VLYIFYGYAKTANIYLLALKSSEYEEVEIDILKTLVPGYATSVEQVVDNMTLIELFERLYVYCFQSTRLDLGDAAFAISWVSSRIIFQTLVHNFVLSILLSEDSNIGNVNSLTKKLVTNLAPLLSVM